MRWERKIESEEERKCCNCEKWFSDRISYNENILLGANGECACCLARTLGFEWMMKIVS